MPPLQDFMPHIVGPLAMGSSGLGFAHDFWRFTHDWGLFVLFFGFSFPPLCGPPLRCWLCVCLFVCFWLCCPSAVFYYAGFSLSELRPLGHRVAFWQGDEDRSVPSSHSVRLAAQLPTAEFHLVKGGTHFLPHQHLEQIMLDMMRSDL